MAHEPASSDPGPPSRGDRIAWTFLTLLSPFLLAWTGWNFWRLATTGKLWVRDGVSVFETDHGIHFWVTLGLYVVLSLGALVLIGVAVGRLRKGAGPPTRSKE